jgi:hypothetical protein
MVSAARSNMKVAGARLCFISDAPCSFPFYSAYSLRAVRLVISRLVIKNEW